MQAVGRFIATVACQRTSVNNINLPVRVSWAPLECYDAESCIITSHVFHVFHVGLLALHRDNTPHARMADHTHFKQAAH